MHNQACFSCLTISRRRLCRASESVVSIEFSELGAEDTPAPNVPVTELKTQGKTDDEIEPVVQKAEEDDELNVEDEISASDIPMQIERAGWQRTFVYVVEPIEHIFRATIPERFPFVGSCVWILFISYTLIQLTKLSGCTLNVPLSIMGIILLAGGTSIPDLLASIFVSKQMKGDMAIANISGSNISNALIGLGLPWTIQTILFGDHDPTTENLEYFMTFLGCSLFFSLAIFVCRGFVLDRLVGFILIALYFVFCAFVVFVVEDI